MPNSVKIKIAGLCTKVHCDNPRQLNLIKSYFRLYLSNKRNVFFTSVKYLTPTIDKKISSLGEVNFLVKSKLYQNGNAYTYNYVLAPYPDYALGTIDFKNMRGELYLGKKDTGIIGDYFLTCYCNLLGLEGNFFLHSSYLVLNNRGYLFIGPSGSGKTTIANLLLNSKKGFVLVSDDLIGVYKENGHFLGSATPWRAHKSRMIAPIKKLFFIHQANKFKIARISLSNAAIKIISNLQLYNNLSRMNIPFILKNIYEIVKIIPAHDLYFLNVKSFAKDFVEFLGKKEGNQ